MSASTAVVHPIRAAFKGKFYGLNTAFVVESTLEDGSKQVMPIYPRDYEVRSFRQFKLTREALESKDSLQKFLDEQRRSGNFNVKSVTVFDPKEMRDDTFDLYGAKPIE